MNKNSQAPERFAINFDLIQDELKQNGFYSNPLYAYTKLGKEFTKLGYEKRQQSSWISKKKTDIFSVITDLVSISRKLPWLSKCTRHMTATAENAILDLNPFIENKINLNEFIKDNKLKGNEQEKRAVHFDLGVHKIDNYYPYRSKAYNEVSKTMKQLGFEWQQRSGWISKEELEPDDFAYKMQQLKNMVPNLKNIINQVDATYLKSSWNLMEYIDPNYKPKIDDSINYINPDTLKAESKDKLTQNELLQLNMHVRHKEINPDVLINKKFDYDNEEYQIKSIDVLDNGKDNVVLERTSDGMKFKEEDFASLPDFKLHYGKEAQKAPIKQKSNEKIKI